MVAIVRRKTDRLLRLLEEIGYSSFEALGVEANLDKMLADLERRKNERNMTPVSKRRKFATVTVSSSTASASSQSSSTFKRRERPGREAGPTFPAHVLQEDIDEMIDGITSEDVGILDMDQ